MHRHKCVYCTSMVEDVHHVLRVQRKQCPLIHAAHMLLSILTNPHPNYHVLVSNNDKAMHVAGNVQTNLCACAVASV